jgi:hypothetical protein
MTYKTFIDDGHTTTYGVTPRSSCQTVAAEVEVYWGKCATFTPLQTVATKDAITRMTESELSMEMWIISETPRLVKIFGKAETVPDVSLPEYVTVTISETNDRFGEFYVTTCQIINNQLVLPELDTYPSFIHFSAPLIK